MHGVAWFLSAYSGVSFRWSFQTDRQSVALVLTTKLETNRMRYGKTLKKTLKTQIISKDGKKLVSKTVLKLFFKVLVHCTKKTRHKITTQEERPIHHSPCHTTFCITKITNHAQLIDYMKLNRPTICIKTTLKCKTENT